MAFRCRPVFKVVAGLHFFVFIIVTLGSQPFGSIKLTDRKLDLLIGNWISKAPDREGFKGRGKLRKSDPRSPPAEKSTTKFAHCEEARVTCRPAAKLGVTFSQRGKIFAMVTTSRDRPPARSPSRGEWKTRRQTHRHPDPGKRKTKPKTKMIELRVLGSRGLKWVKQRMKEATGRLLGACPWPPSLGKEKRESGAPPREAEVCKLNPTPGSDSIAP